MLSSLKMIVFTRNYYRKYLLIIAIFCTFADENCVKYRHGNSIKAPCGVCGLSRKLATMTRKFDSENYKIKFFGIKFLAILDNFCSPQKGT